MQCLDQLKWQNHFALANLSFVLVLGQWKSGALFLQSNNDTELTCNCRIRNRGILEIKINLDSVPFSSPSAHTSFSPWAEHTDATLRCVRRSSHPPHHRLLLTSSQSVSGSNYWLNQKHSWWLFFFLNTGFHLWSLLILRLYSGSPCFNCQG